TSTGSCGNLPSCWSSRCLLCQAMVPVIAALPASSPVTVHDAQGVRDARASGVATATGTAALGRAGFFPASGHGTGAVVPWGGGAAATGGNRCGNDTRTISPPG